MSHSSGKMTPGSGSGIMKKSVFVVIKYILDVSTDMCLWLKMKLPEMFLSHVPLNIGAKVLGHVTPGPRALVDCLHTFSLKQKRIINNR